MSATSDLDIVLTAHKLSDAQKNAVVELLGGGFTSAKSNTVKSLEKKGLVVQDGDDYTFSPVFEAELKAAREPSFHEQLMTDDVKKLAASQGIALTDEEANQVAQEDPNPWTLGPETFNKDWAMWELELCGFEATIGWNNTDVWHGLTAQEIREDMDTALPIGRKARRERARIIRKALVAV